MSNEHVRLIGGFANALLAASNLLADDANRALTASYTVNAMGYNVMDVENLPQILAGAPIGEIVLRSFTTEVLLKGLIEAYGGSPPNEHNLLKLWNKLPESARDAISLEFDSTGTQTIQNVFAATPNPFVDWRYLYEANSDKSIDIELMRRITSILFRNMQTIVRLASTPK